MSTPSDQQKMECKTVNDFYFPEFIRSLERIAKEFPIWTVAALPGKQPHASTASQEGYFAELRNKIFEDIPLPCSTNRFLKEHINDLHSGTNEVAAKLKHFNHNHKQPVPSPHIPEKESASQKFAIALRALGKRPKLTLKKSARSDQDSEFYSQITVLSPCSSTDIKSASSVRKPASDPRSGDEGSKSLSQQQYININFDLISLLRERARMVNNSDLKSGEGWRGLVNEESFLVDVNEISPENQEESKNVEDTSQILSELLDLQNGDIANIDQNLFFIEPNNNNTHDFSTNYEQNKLFTKKESTLTAELSTPN